MICDLTVFEDVRGGVVELKLIPEGERDEALMLVLKHSVFHRDQEAEDKDMNELILDFDLDRTYKGK